MPMGPMETQVGEQCQTALRTILTAAQYAQGTPYEDKVVEDILDQFPLLSRGNKFHAMLATSSIPEGDQLLPSVR